jgi:hypothetical protein
MGIAGFGLVHAMVGVICVFGLLSLPGCCVVGAQPVADAGLDQNTTSGTPVTLDGRGSTPGGGTTLSYQWSYVSGPPATQVTWVSAKNQSTAQVTCNGDGDYKFKLRVTNELFGASEDTVWLHVGAAFHQVIPPGVVPLDPQ